MKNKGMGKGALICIIGTAVVALLVVIAISWAVAIYNTEVRLANRYDAQFNEVETSLDTMRKTIMNQFKVTREFADKFIQSVAMQTEGRKGGALFKSSAEAANKLGMDSAMYMKMANSIEGQLAKFKRSQDVLTDVWREHKTHCEVFPNSIFVGDRVKEKPEMISSKATKAAIETKELDDDLLGGDKKKE